MSRPQRKREFAQPLFARAVRGSLAKGHVHLLEQSFVFPARYPTIGAWSGFIFQ
jgi:hypothetical protein